MSKFASMSENNICVDPLISLVNLTFQHVRGCVNSNYRFIEVDFYVYAAETYNGNGDYGHGES